MTESFIPYHPNVYADSEMKQRASEFELEMDARRSVRRFSEKPVPRELIEAAIRTASTAPSGAHRQPWQFVAVSDPVIKHDIRNAVEHEEQRIGHRAYSVHRGRNSGRRHHRQVWPILPDAVSGVLRFRPVRTSLSLQVPGIQHISLVDQQLSRFSGPML